MVLDTVWALLFARILVCASTFTREIIRCYSPNRDSYGVLAAAGCARFRKGVGAGAVSWLSACLRRAAALVGCWRHCRCCQLAKRTGAGVSWLCALWRCRKLAVQAAYILVPASHMSTGRGILPSYLGLCWCNCSSTFVGNIWESFIVFSFPHPDWRTFNI